MRFKAIIFDMDGLLIDSEYHWDNSSAELLAKRGVVLTSDLNRQLVGQSLRKNMELFKTEYGWAESVDELMDEFRSATDHIYRHLTQPMPGATALLSTLQTSPAKRAIASGSSLPRIECIVDRFGWRPHFSALVSSDHVGFVGKPDPAIYNYTADLLKVSPEHCVVIEDSYNGLLSAKAAGMRCIMVPEKRWDKFPLAGADLVADSLEDPRLFAFLEMVYA